MKIKLHENFVRKLTRQVAYIAADKPKAARKFKNDLLTRIKAITDFPFKNKRSIYFDSDNIRDLTFKGYTVTYKVDSDNKVIEVFGLTKMDLNPEK
jgi:plasmid stabilization system protein ParE